jgi:hypothetical protein
MGHQQGDEADLFAAFNDQLQRQVARAVNTSRANVEDACAMAWATFLRRQPDRDRTAGERLHRHPAVLLEQRDQPPLERIEVLVPFIAVASEVSTFVATSTNPVGFSSLRPAR